MTQIFHEIVPSADLVYFFDTDIVITHAWSTLAEWARERRGCRPRHGRHLYVAVSCISTSLQVLAAKIDRKCRDFTGYVNSGCVGINRQFAEFAEVWALLMDELCAMRGYDSKSRILT